jgi:hypothetical protein
MSECEGTFQHRGAIGVSGSETLEPWRCVAWAMLTPDVQSQSITIRPPIFRASSDFPPYSSPTKALSASITLSIPEEAASDLGTEFRVIARIQ